MIVKFTNYDNKTPIFVEGTAVIGILPLTNGSDLICKSNKRFAVKEKPEEIIKMLELPSRLFCLRCGTPLSDTEGCSEQA